MIMDTRSLYHALDESRREIRLLTLLPCEDDEGQIACRLETASLGSDCEYAAISYVWGDADATTEILVNNVAFSATTNLVSGLRHFLRYGLGLPGKDDASLPRLWVDAICINQQDTAERNRQVALMGEIYTGARYVLTWLGLPGRYMFDTSLRLIRSFSESLPSQLKKAVIERLESRGEKDHGAEGSMNGDSYDNDNDNGGGLWTLKARDGIDPETELVQEGLKWIAEHPNLHVRDTYGVKKAWRPLLLLPFDPYWQRVWIQQEIVLCRGFSANLVRCGAEAVAFEDIVLFLTLMSALDRRSITPPDIDRAIWTSFALNFERSMLESVVTMRAVWKRKVSSLELVPLIARQCKATDPRDMVYGLRSLLHLNLDVDYDKTVREVYLDWHAGALQNCRALGKLESCGINWAGRGISGENPRDLPSWMPDLAIMHKPRYVDQDRGGAKLGPGGRFQLVGADGQQYSEDGVLSVYGVECDHVCKSQWIAGVTSRADKTAEVLRTIAVDYLQEMKTRDHPTGLRPLQALLYTIHQGTDPDTKEPFPLRLDQTSMLARVFRFMVFYDQATDPSQGSNQVDLQASGGLGAYLDSQFRDDADEDENERWLSVVGEISEDDMAHEASQLMARLFLFLDNRTLFYTTDGYIGMGPQYLEVGDQLCVINNCELPVLLRAEGSGHVLVGAVYVYGLSGNESLDLLKSGKVNLEKFEIH
ncbi:heterokaryon incompatibility protein-domain-containing protein [Diaporthe sp. PMI_573]|nr:heterokaryon incompatibility protein-domain-containing protein [Diaporthaceae sp. PMI_573]